MQSQYIRFPTITPLFLFKIAEEEDCATSPARGPSRPRAQSAQLPSQAVEDADLDALQPALSENGLMEVETLTVAGNVGEKDANGAAPHPPVVESVTAAAVTAVADPIVGEVQMDQAPLALVEAATAVVTAVAVPSAPARSKRSGRQHK